MIIKPFTVKSPARVTRLAAHLARTAEDNEIARIEDVRGMGKSRDLDKLLHRMHRTRAATKGERGLFHVTINPDQPEAERMSPEDWQRCIAPIEAEFGLAEQPRVIVLHHKRQDDGTTRPHLHVVYQVADVERRRQVDDFANSGRRCGRISRELERELGHAQRPERSDRQSFDLPEQAQAKRAGHTVEERRAALRAAWNDTPDGAAFQVAVRGLGFELAQGKRLCLVLPDGGHVSLSRELKGAAKTRELRQRLEAAQLPELDQAKDLLAERFERDQEQRTTEELAASFAATATETTMTPLDRAIELQRQINEKEQKRRTEWVGQRVTQYVQNGGMSPAAALKRAEREYSEMRGREQQAEKEAKQLQAKREREQREDFDRMQTREQAFAATATETTEKRVKRESERQPMTDEERKRIEAKQREREERKRQRDRGRDIDF